MRNNKYTVTLDDDELRNAIKATQIVYHDHKENSDPAVRKAAQEMRDLQNRLECCLGRPDLD